jgi:hypothetical protein
MMQCFAQISEENINFDSQHVARYEHPKRQSMSRTPATTAATMANVSLGNAPPLML